MSKTSTTYANVQELLHTVSQELESRDMRYTKLDLMNYLSEPDREAKLVYPGTITLLVARKGSALLARVAEMVRAGKPVEESTIREILDPLKSRKELSVEVAARVVQQQPVLAELRYGGKSLISALCVPDGLDVAMAILPYNGGRLLQAGFTLVERITPGSSAALEAIVLVRQPKLSAAEAAALQLVPDDQLELSVGSARSVDGADDSHCWIVVAVLVVAVLFVTVTLACGATVFDPTIGEDELKRLGPNGTARKLLELRRKLLARQLAGA